MAALIEQADAVGIRYDEFKEYLGEQVDRTAKQAAICFSRYSPQVLARMAQECDPVNGKRALAAMHSIRLPASKQ